MAGDWIKIRVGLWDDPAVIGIARTLGISIDEVVGKLARLWGWADQQTSDGYAPNVTTEWIDVRVERNGFATALAKEGWLEIKDGGVQFPNFERHMGKSAKNRCQSQLRMRKLRSKRNHTVTQEPSPEKRREEKRRDDVPPPSPSLQEELVSEWNQLGKPFPQIRDLTDKRRKAIQARMRKTAWRDGWREALTMMAASDFCTGQNDRGWVANIDWFLRPDTVTKLLEGAYNGTQQQGFVDIEAIVATDTQKEDSHETPW